MYMIIASFTNTQVIYFFDFIPENPNFAFG
jgi:hypothetical protein